MIPPNKKNMCGSGYAPKKNRVGRFLFFCVFFYKFQMETNDFLLLPFASLHDAFIYGVILYTNQD